MRAELVDLLVCPYSGTPLQLVPYEAAGDDVRFGVLKGAASTFPIIEGIPVLRGGDEDALHALEGGDPTTATALAMTRNLAFSRIDAIVPMLLALRPGRPVARWLRRRLDDARTARVSDALGDSLDDPDPLLRLTHLAHRAPNREGYNYFSRRLGLPRHLVALGAVAAARPDMRPVVEIGSGAGHLTWQFLALLAPRRVVALESQLDLAWVASRHLAPGADVVCADALNVPLRDSTCSLGIAVDVLSFVTAKSAAVRELRRVTGVNGGLVLTSLINASTEHEFAGQPLPAGAWRSLVDGPHIAFSDRVVLNSYLARRTPPARSDTDDELTRAPTLTLLAGEAATTGLDIELDDWPHAIGQLGLHPLLSVVEHGPVQIVAERRVPSPEFARDNSDICRYLPQRVVLPSDAFAAARRGCRTPDLEDAIAHAAVLGYPATWHRDPWAT